jgi:hypothetical protein
MAGYGMVGGFCGQGLGWVAMLCLYVFGLFRTCAQLESNGRC